MGWAESVLHCLRDTDVSIISYVPDVVTWRVVSMLENDPRFQVVPATREEEALGIVAGAYAAGKRGAVFMQSSGFGNSINALTTLCIPARIAFPIFISMRGDLGEFSMAQIPGGRAVRPIWDALGLQYFTLTREDEVAKVVTGAIELCYAGRLPVGLLLPTLLTGGKRGTR